MEPKKYSAGWIYGTLAFGVVCGAIIYYFMKPDPCKGCCPDDPKPGPVAMTGFLDGAAIASIADAPDAWGGRFYLAARADGSLTVLVGPIKEDGSHVPYEGETLEFRLFNSIADSRTELTPLSEERAEEVVKAASTAERPTWSLDVKAEVLKGLMEGDGVNGIGFQMRPTTDASWGFDVAPVTLTGDEAYLAGTPEKILMGAFPCPMHCPKEPALYLHLR
ncbi:MAG: hypothetical protein IPM46_10930 [Flavobacteriales bacterium]|nr:hypothetical protein [Flavobacteriales bacterium]